MNEVRQEGQKAILTVMERVVQMFPEGGPQLLVPCLEVIITKLLNKEEVRDYSLAVCF